MRLISVVNYSTYCIHNYPMKLQSLTLIFLIWLPLVSCSLFDTRDPDEPGSTSGPRFIQTDRPENVVENLVNAVTHMNLDHYLRILCDQSFSYEPSSIAQADRGPDFWQGWGLPQEEGYFRQLQGETEGRGDHRLQLHNESFLDLGDNEVRFEYDYTLTINHGKELPEEATGKLILDMVQDELHGWVICTWSDRDGDSDFTWSDIRAEFLN